VELIDGDAASTRAKMRAYESQRVIARLFFNPFDGEAHYRFGGLLLDAGKFQQAHAHLTFALAFVPRLDSAYYLRAQAAMALKRWDDAVADLTRYLDRVPHDNLAREMRAIANRWRKRHAEAAEDLTIVLGTYATSPELYEMRAMCYEAMGKPDLARADRQRILKLNASDPTSLNNMAWHLVTGPPGQRDAVKALELIQRAIALRPDEPTYLNTLGLVLYRNRQYAQAIVALEKSLAHSKNTAAGYDLFILAMCHAQQGNAEKAKDCFDRAVQWTDTKKDLPPDQVAELATFRAEAEKVLRGK
jgi:tetratricopeptide (TPR) repeat protein